MTLNAKGVNEHGVAMCACRNAAARPHAWEPGEACGDRVIPKVVDDEAAIAAELADVAEQAP